MSLLTTIKAKQLEARKSRDALSSSLLTTLLGEAAMPGKNDGNRESTDAEVVATIKKFIKNAQEVVKATEPQDNIQAASRCRDAKIEITILESFLPQQLTEVELRKIIADGLEQLAKSGLEPAPMGWMMGKLKQEFTGRYDGGLASKLIKEAIDKKWDDAVKGIKA